MLTGIFIAVIAALWFFNAKGRSGATIVLLFFVPYFVCGYLLTAQRLRDMNATGWLALLWLPVGVADRHIGGAASFAFFIILCAVPGTLGHNRYGPDPLVGGEE